MSAVKFTRREFTKITCLSAASFTLAGFKAFSSLELDQEFIEDTKRKIEMAILTIMEEIYLHDREIFDDSYRSGLKFIEKVVSYYDYQATGISVLAQLAIKGNPRALTLIKKLQKNMRYYQRNFFNTNIESRFWTVPLRRLLLHIALAYEKLEPILSQEEKKQYRELMEEQVPLAIKHNRNFLPGEKDLHLKYVNNHTAIFMQGIYYCGKVFKKPEWVTMMLDFAERFYNSGHPDGYFEEHTNESREGGPSLVYTRLTAGCLYDILNGKKHPLEKFIKAGNFYRSFINHDYQMIPIADERTNHNSKGIEYGLALHSLTPQGRYFIVDNLESLDYSKLSPEGLAVLYHELDLMVPGNCELPENKTKSNSRITLPLGIVRKNGYTAGLSALRALNWAINKNSDYALDQQNMVYLSHQKTGVILTGFKSKRDPEYSTFRIGDDAYTIKTGELKMGDGWAEAHLYYQAFNAKIRWEITDTAKLILSVNSDQTVTSSFPIIGDSYVKTDQNYKIKKLNGFSPYTEANKSKSVKAAIFRWQKELTIEFVI